MVLRDIYTVVAQGLLGRRREEKGGGGGGGQMGLGDGIREAERGECGGVSEVGMERRCSWT